ncbi:MAG: hypothetical protein ACYDH6_17470 [Acidimicrobiales bacterium]
MTGGRAPVPALVVAALIAVAAVACSSGPSGLGKKACPYVRPRLVRLDAARLGLAASRAAATNSIVAVDQDMRLYIATNVPSGGKAPSDRRLVAFSAALDQFATSFEAVGPALDRAENALKQECGVALT